jgi:hypothetical protein
VRVRAAWALRYFKTPEARQALEKCVAKEKGLVASVARQSLKESA